MVRSRTSLHRLWSLFSGLVCLAVSTSCYQYQTIPSSAISPGMDIRAHLSDQGMLGLEDLLGELRRTVDGSVTEVDDGYVVLLSSVGQSGQTVAPGSLPLRQRIVIEREHLGELQERRLDRVKTMGAALLVTVVLGAAAVHFFTGESRGEIEEPGGPLPENLQLPSGWRLPLIRH